jgi:hypothetical protein
MVGLAPDPMADTEGVEDFKGSALQAVSLAIEYLVW